MGPGVQIDEPRAEVLQHLGRGLPTMTATAHLVKDTGDRCNERHLPMVTAIADEHLNRRKRRGGDFEVASLFVLSEQSTGAAIGWLRKADRILPGENRPRGSPSEPTMTLRGSLEPTCKLTDIWRRSPLLGELLHLAPHSRFIPIRTREYPAPHSTTAVTTDRTDFDKSSHSRHSLHFAEEVGFEPMSTLRGTTEPNLIHESGGNVGGNRCIPHRSILATESSRKDLFPPTKENQGF